MRGLAVLLVLIVAEFSYVICQVVCMGSGSIVERSFSRERPVNCQRAS